MRVAADNSLEIPRFARNDDRLIMFTKNVPMSREGFSTCPKVRATQHVRLMVTHGGTNHNFHTRPVPGGTSRVALRESKTICAVAQMCV